MTDIDERRLFETRVELQAVGRPYRYLEGRAVPYDTWADVSWFREQHRYGSFKRSTLNGRTAVKLPLLLFHDNQSWPIGHAESWSHPDDGLHGVWQLDDSADAQRAARMAEDGHLTGLSVGFTDAAAPVWEFPDDFDPMGGPDQRARVTRVESRLVEVSLTPTPAFVDAGVTLVRTRARQPAPKVRDVERWRAIAEELRARG